MDFRPLTAVEGFYFSARSLLVLIWSRLRVSLCMTLISRNTSSLLRNAWGIWRNTSQRSRNTLVKICTIQDERNQKEKTSQAQEVLTFDFIH